MRTRFAHIIAITVAVSCGASATAFAAPGAHTVPDTIAQRVQACTACHGKEGVATNQGYFPRIAGKPAGYLYNQLINFRDGRRSNGVMTALIENISDDYLMEIATHFASLDLPYAQTLAPASPSPALARGEALVRRGDEALRVPACVQCHGASMTGVAPATPGLLGLPKAYVLSQFGAWRLGQRHAAPPDCMGDISRRLSTEDISSVATYLAQRPLPADSKPASSVPLPLPMACGNASK